MINLGARPIDKDSLVGQVRLSIGDTNFTELEPVETSVVNYANFSDDELEVLLAGADENVLRATARAYAKLAAIAAATGATIKTNDLGHSTERRAGELRALADWWRGEADAADELASDDFLEIVRFPGTDFTDPARPTFP
ncbi:hypothetical protein G7068_16195 [Leucobacter viscericola]|uniref:Uncharacterized protein n=1 Tax=Leucobacter viscericola TaxID=2714935 RepID=A0A6G7XJ52_9MICO|nr:hypothetical protein [Leucobacter viscericola]QIK64516.1 hypothetical protein G7068_15835 [Leucobacter viscericola]QIK64588.1 hypothetical protein G7068_16195 [Leucobacter viscericola]